MIEQLIEKGLHTICYVGGIPSGQTRMWRAGGQHGLLTNSDVSSYRVKCSIENKIL